MGSGFFCTQFPSIFYQILGDLFWNVSTNWSQKSLSELYFSTVLACQRVFHFWDNSALCKEKTGKNFLCRQMICAIRTTSFWRKRGDLFSRQNIFTVIEDPEMLPGLSNQRIQLLIIFAQIGAVRRSLRYLTYLRSVVSVFAWPRRRAMIRIDLE